MAGMFHTPMQRILFGALFLFILIISHNIVQADEVTLAWDPNTPTPDGYKVFKRLNGQDYDYNSPICPKPGEDPAQTTCTETNLANETTYFFVVRAYVGSDLSGDSNEISYTTGPAESVVYSIATDADGSGSITPGSATVAAGDSQTFTIAADLGFQIADVFIDNESVGSRTSYTFDNVTAPHSIRAVFVPITHMINASAGPNGSISPSGQIGTVNAGDQTFTITPHSGYRIDDVVVDGQSVGHQSSYTFNNVTSPHTIRATFAPVTHLISASAGSNGSISPSGQIGTVNAGNQTFTITPHSGYRIDDVAVDGQSVGSQSSYAFNNVTSPHTIRATFAPVTHLISASAGSNGSITPAGQVSVAHAENRSFIITPQAGYRIADVMVDGVSAGTITMYTFTDVVSDHTIDAVFVADRYTIEASRSEGGFITPEGSVTVTGQSDQVFNIAAENGYEIDDLIVDGNSVGAQDSYTFSRIDANHTIMVAFRAVDQAPTADAGPDQVVAEQALVSLNGLNSKDVDDGIASFEWRQVEGIPVELSSPSDEIVTFTAPDVDVNGEALEFELTVTDNDGNSSVDSCIVNVTWVNEAPLANAGTDQSVNEGSTVELNAADSMDPDDGIDQYQWRQVEGPQVVLQNPDTFSPSFTALDVGPQGTSLVFELTVTDAGGLQDTDRCTVSVTWDNMEPLADAGPDREAVAEDVIALDGSGSMDPDGLNLNYQWRQTFGPPVTLSDATSVRPQFTVPTMDDADTNPVLTFELTVTDSGGLNGVDTCQVSIQPSSAPPEDATPPTLTIDKPALNWAVVFNRRYRLSGSADDDQQLARVEWKNSRGGSGETNGTTQWWKTISLRRGLNVITITAFDTTGNNTSKEIHIYRFKWGR